MYCRMFTMYCRMLEGGRVIKSKGGRGEAKVALTTEPPIVPYSMHSCGWVHVCPHIETSSWPHMSCFRSRLFLCFETLGLGASHWATRASQHFLGTQACVTMHAGNLSPHASSTLPTKLSLKPQT